MPAARALSSIARRYRAAVAHSLRSRLPALPANPARAMPHAHAMQIDDRPVACLPLPCTMAAHVHPDCAPPHKPADHKNNVVRRRGNTRQFLPSARRPSRGIVLPDAATQTARPDADLRLPISNSIGWADCSLQQFPHHSQGEYLTMDLLWIRKMAVTPCQPRQRLDCQSCRSQAARKNFPAIPKTRQLDLKKIKNFSGSLRQGLIVRYRKLAFRSLHSCAFVQRPCLNYFLD